MDPSILAIVICVAVAAIAATFLFLLRDLFGRQPSPEPADNANVDLSKLLPPTETIPQDNSWLGRLAIESGFGLTAETALLFAILVSLIFGGSMFLWRDDLVAGATGAVIGIMLVGFLLIFFRARRNNAIRDQLPDCMDLMARAVRAGESLDQAIALVGNSQLRPVATEFRYCASQMRMGLSLESAVRGMVARVPLIETRILAMTLIVQRRRGGSLPVTLERLARVFRDRLSFYRQFRASTALGRASAGMIALIGIGLDAFMVFGNSDYAQKLVTTNIGHVLLVLALVLQVVGVSWAVWLFRSRY
jgi:tight adherence protein B